MLITTALKTKKPTYPKEEEEISHHQSSMIYKLYFFLRVVKYFFSRQFLWPIVLLFSGYENITLFCTHHWVESRREESHSIFCSNATWLELPLINTVATNHKLTNWLLVRFLVVVVDWLFLWKRVWIPMSIWLFMVNGFGHMGINHGGFWWLF